MNVRAIDNGDWKLLLDKRSETGHETCVSIFMPTYRPKGDGRQDPIRLRNLLNEAEKALSMYGHTPEETAEMLAPAHALVEEEIFWRKQKTGLAVFCAPGFFRAYHVPLEMREQVRVGDRFSLRPLMPLYQTRGRFYILALSRNEVRLLEGRRDEIRRIDLPDSIPTSFDDALGYDQYDSVKQVHSTSTSGLGRQPGMVHGHGDNDQEKIKKDILHYFQIVAQKLGKHLKDTRAPVVLAAVQGHFPLFREANRQLNLLDLGLTGNPEGLSDKVLHDRAWELIEPYFLQEAEEAIERFGELRAAERATSKVEELVPAAREGRVDVLLVADDPELWGRFDRESARVTLHPEPESGDEDLLDLAAYDTLTHGGVVFTLPKDRLPDGGPAAALFRY